MRNLFFHGTLRDVPLLEVVLGRPAADLDLTSTQLADYRVSSVAEGPFPMIEEMPGALAEGLLVKGLSVADIERLDFYEGSFAYDLYEVTLIDGQSAKVYVPQPDLWTPQGPWDLGAWQVQWGMLSRFAAEEVMGYLGKRDRKAVAAIFSRIRSRAQARVDAQSSLHGARTFHGQVDLLRQNRVYSNYYALDEIRLRHAQFDGTMSDNLERAVFVGGDAAMVLPYDPKRDRVMLVEQIRMGPLVRGDGSVWQLEPIAGGIDPGETPQTAARREAQEEAGLTLNALEKIAEVYASPGNATEFFYIFLGLADLPDAAEGVGGRPDEHEDIRSHLMSFVELMELCDSFAACNAPLVLAANWLARHRERLRSEGGGATPEQQ